MYGDYEHLAMHRERQRSRENGRSGRLYVRRGSVREGLVSLRLTWAGFLEEVGRRAVVHARKIRESAEVRRRGTYSSV